MYGFGAWAPIGALIMIAVIGLVVWLIAGGGRPERRDADASKAIDLLADRYARGEIDGAEYQRRKSVIEGGI